MNKTMKFNINIRGCVGCVYISNIQTVFALRSVLFNWIRVGDIWIRIVEYTESDLIIRISELVNIFVSHTWSYAMYKYNHFPMLHCTHDRHTAHCGWLSFLQQCRYDKETIISRWLGKWNQLIMWLYISFFCLIYWVLNSALIPFDCNYDLLSITTHECC